MILSSSGQNYIPPCAIIPENNMKKVYEQWVQKELTLRMKLKYVNSCMLELKDLVYYYLFTTKFILIHQFIISISSSHHSGTILSHSKHIFPLFNLSRLQLQHKLPRTEEMYEEVIWRITGDKFELPKDFMEITENDTYPSQKWPINSRNNGTTMLLNKSILGWTPWSGQYVHPSLSS